MEQKTKKITTPIAKVIIELKEWVTGGEYRDIKNMIFKEMKIQTIGSEAKIEPMNGNFMELVENKELETVIVSVNDKKEDILKNILSLPTKDYLFIKAEVKKIVDLSE